ncbi:zinc transporter foi [Drosophila subobscura]|uniref:zinc transporter foi n=1 Tax=Drosophila subobscura TaxID=7241 RepID=UPI00155A202B|nr:zinc transporter foi [Drosophila subobscura]XP_034658450.1 zinc transporter foi [Drosophila subobscura]XP_034658451.1 zinc transporter foi [Drosophila subobscura]XP_034658452.1 zinc transporter foi [Drosophila subobscura]
MARHIMAVCVVCLLCAHRLHCQDHVESLLAGATVKHSEEQLNARVYTRLSSPSSETTDQRQQLAIDDTQNYSTSPPSRRNKRHAEEHGHGHGHGHSEPQVPQITRYFLDKLMAQQEAMDSSGFNSFLQQINLPSLVASEGTCVPASRLVQHVQPHDLSHHSHSHSEETEGQELQLKNCTLSNNGTNSNVVCAPQLTQNSSSKSPEASANFTLSERDVLHLCPVLLHELWTQSGGCIDLDVLAQIDSTEKLLVAEKDMFYVWVYAFISVFACGILGLVGVAIIPFMGSRYYKHIIQYLVSLAVGTMTGDALLHLLPHSLAGQDERGMIMKGLGCLGGIIFFYITEHALTMISEWRKSVEKKETKKPSRAKVMRDPDSSVNNSVAGDKICKQKYSSYPYCYDEITMNNKQSEWMHLPGDGVAAAAAGAGGDAASASELRNGLSDHDGSSEMAAAAESLLSTLHTNCVEMNHHNHKHNNHQQHPHQEVQDNNTIVTDLDGNAVYAASNSNSKAVDGGKDGKNDHVTVILREHESSHHGHSHRHGHVHSPPETLSAVAWMIIMGDGLHNFTDGMAIGAAFAENIAGGFSTSLAVFCHELPHELGDFAILMKAGMSVKSAVYYNLLTGVLSFIGMIFGIAFGQSQDVAQWMFAVAAGLFIYIALVDMMPEISASHKSLAQFLLQILGMLSGVGIMLIIALFEGDLMSVFGTAPPSAAHHQHVH